MKPDTDNHFQDSGEASVGSHKPLITFDHTMYMIMANKSRKRFTVSDPARRVASEKVMAEMVQQMAVSIPVISPR